MDESMNYLRIANEDDRNKVAVILFENGYVVQKTRRKKNGKSFEYFVGYRMGDQDSMPGGENDEG